MTPDQYRIVDGDGTDHGVVEIDDVTVIVHEPTCAGVLITGQGCTCEARPVPGVQHAAMGDRVVLNAVQVRLDKAREVRHGWVLLPIEDADALVAELRVARELLADVGLDHLLADAVAQHTQPSTSPPDRVGAMTHSRDFLDRQNQQIAEYEQLRAWIAAKIGAHPAVAPARLLEQHLTSTMFVNVQIGDRFYALNGVPILRGTGNTYGYRYACPRPDCDWTYEHSLFGTFLQNVHRHDRTEHPDA